MLAAATIMREAALSLSRRHQALPAGGPRGAGLNEKEKVLGRFGGSQGLVGPEDGTACWTC